MSLQSLENAVETFNTAFENADVPTLRTMVHDNYVHTNGSWKAFGKEDWLNYMHKRKARIDSGLLIMTTYQMKDRKIELFDNSAIVTGKFQIEGSEEGLSFEREVRISNFWVLEDGEWKRAGFHDTRIE